MASQFFHIFKLLTQIFIFNFFVIIPTEASQFIYTKKFQPISENNQRNIEIDNLKNLPHGFIAFCQNNTLFLRSESSGRFKISNNALCHHIQKRTLICSNSPEVTINENGQTLPLCGQIKG